MIKVIVSYDYYHPRHPVLVTYGDDPGTSPPSTDQSKKKAEALASQIERVDELTECLRWYVRMFLPDDHIVNHTGTDCVHCQARTLLRTIGKAA